MVNQLICDAHKAVRTLAAYLLTAAPGQTIPESKRPENRSMIDGIRTTQPCALGKQGPPDSTHAIFWRSGPSSKFPQRCQKLLQSLNKSESIRHAIDPKLDYGIVHFQPRAEAHGGERDTSQIDESIDIYGYLWRKCYTYP